MEQLFYKYWGKARPSSEGEAQYHLLPYHCLDVAAAGVEYLSLHPQLLDFFCSMGCSRQTFLSWAAFWLAIHDLGKFSEAFQSQKPELFLQLQGREPNPEKQYTERHDTLGQWLWRDYLSKKAEEEKWFGEEIYLIESSLDAWMRAVTGHHGQPPKASQEGASLNFYSKKDKKAAQEFVDEVRSLFVDPEVARIPFLLDPKTFEKLSYSLSWWFAGLTVLADWLGSNTDHFSYKTDEIPLHNYWTYARVQARTALRTAGVVPHRILENLSFKNLFPGIENPSPLQQWAQSVVVSDGPQIYLLEDVTGAGKTEAALILAYRLMKSQNAQGFFVALPTMATANAMYDRIANVYRQLFSGDANLVLAHGSRELVQKFAATVVSSSEPENDESQRDETASARCTAWLADHNKRAILAQAGVGTIDQVLLSVLHSKHQSLRLLGLFGKILIVDEVHACDAYMQGVLEVLLEFHARAGGAVILLSATLPARMKQALLEAYANGLSKDCPAVACTDYPLATGWQFSTPNRLNEEKIATRTAVIRNIQIDYLHEQERVIEQIRSALTAGRCVCWIRNTVSDALEAYARMRDFLHPENLCLFHARFALQDRLKKEDVVLHSFGGKSSAEDRAGKLVIATQVIEQSLDVDFDLVVSDLAPMDRLIQRAGRLRRHNRDEQGNRLSTHDQADQRGETRMTIFGPKWTADPSLGWFKSEFPKASSVYPDHAQLWLTAKALQAGSITMPQDARPLIESVFESDISTLPTGLQKCNLDAQGHQMADASMAKNNTLNFSAGYKRDKVMDWWSEAKTPSRLGDASINVVLGRWQGDRLIPWSSGSHAWAYSTVRIAQRSIERAADIEDSIRSPEYERALETLPDKGKWSVLLPLKQCEAGLWKGQAWTGKDKSGPQRLLTWQYDDIAGLRMVTQEIEIQEES